MSELIQQPEMTAEEFREAQLALGLTDTQLTFVLGFENPQHIRRLRTTGSSSKRVMPHTARLMAAYLAGYRPDDWPIESDEAATLPRPKRQTIEQRLRALEAIVFRRED